MKTLSQIILEAMRRYDFDVGKLSRLTGISERFINALLEEKLDDLPSVPYARGYLKKISEFLNLNGEEIWKIYLKDSQEIKRSGEKDKLPVNRFAHSWVFNRSVIIIVLVVILAGGYFLLRSGFIFGRVDIRFSDFQTDYLVWSEAEFTIRGNIDPLAVLTLNGSRLYPDSEGYFETKVQLQPGLNTFEFKTKKFLSKEKTVIKQIFYGQ